MNDRIKKGIILAGGKGTRLYPSTKIIGKPLLPVYDKPLIYYPLSTLIAMGVKDVLLISTERDLPGFKQLLGDGSDYGIHISYEIQTIAKGIPDAFVIGEKFIGDDNVVLLLGDNIFDPVDEVVEAVKSYQSGSLIFGFPVSNPEFFGVAEVDENGNVTNMEEKPKEPKSNLAIIGLYIFDKQVASVAKKLTKSDRGELEILHVIQHYLDSHDLKFVNLGHSFNWFDAGNPDSVLEVAQYAADKNDVSFGSIAIAAFQNQIIDKSKLINLVEAMPTCMYKAKLEAFIKVLDE